MEHASVQFRDRPDRGKIKERNSQMAPLITVLLLFCGLMQGQTIEKPLPAQELLDSVLWVQTSVEHDAVYRQAYRLARLMLDRARDDKTWTAALEQRAGYEGLPPAVILDIDETILDNSPEEAEMAKTGLRPGLWEEWVRQERAAALPGALEFTRYAAQNHIEVIFVTNRDAATKDATRRNLARLGFPLQHGAESSYCRGEKPEWGTDKGSRRQEIAGRYRILLLIGDDLGDFVSGARVSPEDRKRLVATYNDRWGERWIVLPNPMYGSWETSLYGNNAELSRSEQVRREREYLRPMQSTGGK
jgi:5'-nucleotidase (lipoprotein e(P4) family)